MLLGLCRSTGAFADLFSCVVGGPLGLEDGRADDSLPLPLSLPSCLSCRLCTISSRFVSSQLRTPTPLVNRSMSLPRRSVTCLFLACRHPPPRLGSPPPPPHPNPPAGRTSLITRSASPPRERSLSRARSSSTRTSRSAPTTGSTPGTSRSRLARCVFFHLLI